MNFEPTFSLHIEFAGGSNPMIYYSLAQDAAFKVLIEWSKNYILSPVGYDERLDGYRMMYWKAMAKRTEPDLFGGFENEHCDDATAAVSAASSAWGGEHHE